MRFRGMTAWLGGIFLLASGPSWAAPATSYIPARDDEILEIITPSDLEKNADALKQALAKDPSNTALKSDLIKEYLRLGKQEADLRFHEAAEALLKPELSVAAPPLELLLFQADLLQYRHDFPRALAVLEHVLKRRPGHSQAHLMRAIIYQSQGKLAEALADCRALFASGDLLLATTCKAQVESLSGKLATSYAQLRQIYAQLEPQTPGEEKIWTQTVLGEMAHRAGDDKAAEDYFRAAYQAAPKDFYLLAAYSDMLLNQNRPQEVLTLLPDSTWKVDKLLVLRTLAEKKLNAKDYEAHRALLDARFLLSRQVGEWTHLREQARFYLEAMNDAKLAHELAKKNWETQKEPADALVLMQTAQAMKDDAALSAVKEFITRTGLEDPALSALAKEGK